MPIDEKLVANGYAKPLFTPHHVRLVAGSLPDAVDSRRRELLAEILPEWSYFELQEHLKRPNPVPPGWNEMMQSVSDSAGELLHALKAVREVDREVLAVEMALVVGGLNWTEINKSVQRVEEGASFLSSLQQAALNLKRGRGHPRNIAARLVMMDVAEIFEWLTDREPTRGSDGGDCDVESDPPFWRFAAAIWPVVFGNSDYGLSSAMKNWAEERNEYDCKSAVMLNINMRRPEWGIFER